MKSRLSLYFLIAAFGAPCASIAGGIPVFDATTAANFIKTLQNDTAKIKALNDQVNAWNRQIAMNTGSRGMGNLATFGAIKDLPSSWGSILQQVQTSNGNYANLVDGIVKRNAVLTPEQMAKLPAGQKDLIERARNLGGIQKMMADLATNVAGKQLLEIQALTNQIDVADDPKAIADLTAAINAKKLELDNTQMQLSALERQAQAERELLAQRQRELEIQRTGTKESRQVHISL